MKAAQGRAQGEVAEREDAGDAGPAGQRKSRSEQSCRAEQAPTHGAPPEPPIRRTGSADQAVSRLPQAVGRTERLRRVQASPRARLGGHEAKGDRLIADPV